MKRLEDLLDRLISGLPSDTIPEAETVALLMKVLKGSSEVVRKDHMIFNKIIRLKKGAFGEHGKGKGGKKTNGKGWGSGGKGAGGGKNSFGDELPPNFPQHQWNEMGDSSKEGVGRPNTVNSIFASKDMTPEEIAGLLQATLDGSQEVTQEKLLDLLGSLESGKGKGEGKGGKGGHGSSGYGNNFGNGGQNVIQGALGSLNGTFSSGSGKGKGKGGKGGQDNSELGNSFGYGAGNENNFEGKHDEGF